MATLTQDKINEGNMSFTDMSVSMSEGQAAADRIAANRASKDALSGSVSANDLATPTAQAPVTEVAQPEAPDAVNPMTTNVLGSIRSESENATRLKEEQAAFQSFAGESSGFDIQNEQLNRFGVTPERLQRLSDLELQLNDANVESGVRQAQIAGKAGQTTAAAGRSITQEQVEQRVRNSGLAAEAAILQGNIETGRALAKDAVNIAMQDRTFQANAQLQAIADLKDVVDEETRQLLVGEERKYTEEINTIERVKSAVDSAVLTGAATSVQMAMLTDPNASDEDRLKTAQEVIAGSSSEMRGLELMKIRQSIASSSLSQKSSRLGLCQAGDSSYCSEFNIDPNALTPEEVEARINNQQQSLQLQDGMIRLEGVIANDAGLQLSSGASQSALLTGGLAGPLGGTQRGNAADLLGFVPVVGNIMNYNRAKESKEQFLGDVQYLLGNRVFEKVAEIKSAGYAGAISNVELELMANASSVLNSLAIRDESGANIIGFRGGEENLRKELDLYTDIYVRANDALNTKALQTSTKNDIISEFNKEN